MSKHGLEVDKAKVEVIKHLPPRNDLKKLRGFLGHAGFYRRFIKDFVRIAKPLTNLLSKDVDLLLMMMLSMLLIRLRMLLLKLPFCRHLIGVSLLS